jgi:hypothetical protein
MLAYSSQLKKKLCAELGVDTVRPYSDTIKAMYAQMSAELDEAAPADDDNESAASNSDVSSAEETVKSSKKRKAVATASAPAPAPAAAAAEPPSAAETAIAAFRALGRASGCGPTLYKGLKEMSSQEQLKELRQRLRDIDAKWTGDYPIKAEIDAAQRKKDAERELDGIDTTLIMSSKRRRVSVPPSHDESKEAASRASDSESESADDASDASVDVINQSSDSEDNKPKKSRSKSSSGQSSSSSTKDKGKSSSSSSSSSKMKELDKQRAAVAPSMGVVSLNFLQVKKQQHQQHVDSEEEAEFEG